MIMLRRCTYSDMNIIYKWINDSCVRNNSFNSDYIEYEAHVEWFNEKMNSSNTYMYIILNNNKEIGTARLEKNNSKATISYLISNEYRGKGYGNKIIDLIKKEAIINNIDVLEAVVKKK